MRLRRSTYLPTLAVLAFLPALTSTATAQTATLTVRANTGNDTLYVGMPGAIVVEVDLAAYEMQGASIWIEFVSPNGNIVGSLSEGSNPVWSAAIDSLFAVKGAKQDTLATNPETTWVRLVSFGTALSESGELYRYNSVPTATGTIHSYVEPDGTIPFLGGLFDPAGGTFPTERDTPFVTVVPCSAGNLDGGDANFDRVVNSADIIYLVNHIFKSGPLPVIPNMGDTNCSDAVTSADIILLIGYVFKNTITPCDPCETAQ